MSIVDKHVAWWVGRYPQAESHREDLWQEAAVAHWLSARKYRDDRGATLDTYAWRRMYVAARAYLGRAGVLSGWRATTQVAAQGEAAEEVTKEGPDAPLVLAEAWGALLGGYERRGFTARHAEALARLDVGQTFAEAGAAVGISRQAVQQVAAKAGVHATFTRSAA